MTATASLTRPAALWRPLMVLLLMAWPAAAHDVAITSVARVFIDQIGARRYLVTIIDAGAPVIRESQGLLPAGCRGQSERLGATTSSSGFGFECDEELTFDDVLTFPWSLAGVIAAARWSDGTNASAYFAGNGAVVPIRMGDLRAGAGSRVRLLRRYFMLGAEHILFGIDHLLFVFGLLLLVRSLASLIKTITAFTVAHSLTLAAAVLGLVPVERGPVEAAIALSIVLLAREVVTMHKGGAHLVHRQPWLVAFIFGLLHGLGFAGALGQIGLRSADVPLALLFFNVGVEGGQLGFVAVLLGVNALVRTHLRSPMPALEPALGYGLGTVATFWFIDRLPSVWGA